MRVLLDVTEFAANPINTGIQRVVRELLRGWPPGGPAMAAVRFVPGVGLCALPGEAVGMLAGGAGGGHAGAARELALAVAAACGAGAPAEAEGQAIVVPEVFYDPVRVGWFEGLLARRGGRLGMIAYDFLPWTHPAYFRNPTVVPNMPYLRLLTRAHSVAAISGRTRDAFAARVMRGRARPGQVGPVLPLGADGLRMPREAWRAERRGFVCLGTLDARKNQHVVAEAFIGLWEAGLDVPLTVCGRALEGADLGWVDAARRYPGFTWLDDASDEEVAALLAGARATIYVSEAEGFGLPPVESLHAGIPVIVHDGLPSVAELPPGGLRRISQVTAEAVAAAVLALVDDAACEALWAEAAEVATPTWRAFAGLAAAWAATLEELPP